jgi:hypothetical protein
MKLLLAMLSKGKDVPEFFPDVVKNVVVKSIEVKKMVYIYLVHYADFNDSCREMALLSINSFQRDMSGTNPLIRGLALRVMTSIRVLDIIQIQLLAVRKCATDSSPYVRKCAANAIPKIFSLDPGQIDHLQQIIETLLKDTSTMVLGSVVAAFNEVCPTEYSLLHRNHRKLCHLLADMDEWTQVPPTLPWSHILRRLLLRLLLLFLCKFLLIACYLFVLFVSLLCCIGIDGCCDCVFVQVSVLEVLTRYARNQFTDPAPGVAEAARLQARKRSTASAAAVVESGGRAGGAGGGDHPRTTVRRRVVRKAFYSDEEDESGEEDVDVGFGVSGGAMRSPSAGASSYAEQGSSSVAHTLSGAGACGMDGESLDPDHLLILKSSSPLLKSRNSGVVLAVCSLHFYCGTQSVLTTQQIGKALVRILRNRREVQFVVLNSINAMARERPAIFRPFLSDFFIKSTDPTFNRYKVNTFYLKYLKERVFLS